MRDGEFMRVRRGWEGEDGGLTFVMRSAVSGCGQRVGCLSTASRETVERSFLNSGVSASSTSSLSSSCDVSRPPTEDGMLIFPTDETNATTSMPCVCAR